MWPRSNRKERALLGKTFQLYNNKDCFYTHTKECGPCCQCCCYFTFDICYKLTCFCCSCCCSMETSCWFPIRGHVYDGRKPAKISVIEFCDDGLTSSFEKLMKIKIDTYSNTAIVQITKPWSKILSVFNLHCSFLRCLLNSTSRKRSTLRAEALQSSFRCKNAVVFVVVLLLWRRHVGVGNTCCCVFLPGVREFIVRRANKHLN